MAAGQDKSLSRNPKDTESYYDPGGRSEKGYSQLYIPVLTHIIIVPHGRHFLFHRKVRPMK